MDIDLARFIKQNFAYVVFTNVEIVHNNIKTSIHSLGITELQCFSTSQICNFVLQDENIVFELHVSGQFYYTGLLLNLNAARIDEHLTLAIFYELMKREGAIDRKYQKLLDRISELVIYSSSILSSKVRGISIKDSIMISTDDKRSLSYFQSAHQPFVGQNNNERMSHLELIIDCVFVGLEEWGHFEAYCKMPFMSNLKTYRLYNSYYGRLTAELDTCTVTFRKVREILNALGAKEVP